MSNPQHEAAFGHAAENGHCCGLTKREWFAGMALQALTGEYFKFNGACFSKDHLYANLPAHAYQMADAMLKQREEP